MEPLLVVRDLAVHYVADGRPPSPALRGLRFSVDRAEAVGILGESGCGKSTLALALMRLLPGAAQLVGGAIQFEGRDLVGLNEAEMRRLRGAKISLVFQDPSAALNPVLRIGRQVADVISAHHDWDRGRCREAAIAALREVNLGDDGRIAAAYPHQLSGGQRQRVVLAQALACRPALVVADEPTSALDTTVQADILALLQKLRRELGLTLLLISHDPNVLAQVADRILVMYAGQVVEDGPTQQVLRTPLHPYTQSLLNCIPQNGQAGGATRFTPIRGNPPRATDLVPGCAFEPRCSEKMDVCATRMPAEVDPALGHIVRCFKYGG